MTDAMVMFVATGLGTAVTLAVGLYKDSRNRKWMEQDRQRIANELRIETEKAAQVLNGKVEMAAQLVTQEGDKIRADVAANTRVSEAAKKAAEQAAEKIAVVKADVDDLKVNGLTKKE